MPKPLKSLLIVFSILVFAGILALAWNQWPWPAGDTLAGGASSGAGPGAGKTPQSAAIGAGQALKADSGTAGGAAGRSAESGAPEAGAGGALARTDQVTAPMPEGEAGAGSNAPGAAAQPSFDIVRVEPTGDTVVAGRAVPGATVEILSNGSVVATATADVAGEFVFVLEKPLAAGGHDLALRTLGSDGVSIYSRDNVAVAVPENPSGEVLVVVSEPGAASEILAKPDGPAGASGKTVIAVAPSGEAQIAAAPQAASSDGMSGQQTAQPQAAEPAAIGEPEMAPQTVEVAPAAPVMPEPQQQMAEIAPAAPVAPEPQPQMAEIAPAAPVAPEPQPQTAEIAPAAPVAPEPQQQMAEIAPAAPETQPPPQMAKTATGEKPAGRSVGEVVGGGPAAAVVASVEPVPLGVEAVEVEGGKLYAAGTARPGTTIRIYIDDELAGAATASESGRWLLETEAKVPAGMVVIRADQLAPGTTSVVVRAEVPFTRQPDMAVLIPTASGGAPAGATVKGELPKPNAVIIRRGDNLWTISRRTYGHGIRYTTIYTANKDQIRNPDLIYPGQVFVLPLGDKSWTQ